MDKYWFIAKEHYAYGTLHKHTGRGKEGRGEGGREGGERERESPDIVICYEIITSVIEHLRRDIYNLLSFILPFAICAMERFFHFLFLLFIKHASCIFIIRLLYLFFMCVLLINFINFFKSCFIFDKMIIFSL